MGFGFFRYCIIDVRETTLTSLIFEIVAISSSVIPSAKYSSFGSGLLFEKGRMAILRLSSFKEPFFAFSSGREGPLSQPLSPPGPDKNRQIKEDFFPNRGCRRRPRSQAGFRPFRSVGVVPITRASLVIDRSRKTSI